VDPEKTVVGRQQLGKHVPATTYTNAEKSLGKRRTGIILLSFLVYLSYFEKIE
jgi:hypothetical protein